MDATQTAPGIIRHVGPSGKFNTSRHHLGLCRCVIVTGRYSVCNQEEVDLFSAKIGVFGMKLRVALAEVINRHPMLRVGIANEGSASPTFVALRAINLQQVIDWRSYAKRYNMSILTKSLEADHDQIWQQVDSHPPWKIVIHQPPATESKTDAGFIDISFAFHHAICDAESALIFHRDLVQALNNNTKDPMPTAQNAHILSVKQVSDLPGPLEDIVPLKTSWIFLLGVIFSTIWSKFAPAWLKADPINGCWGGKQIAFEPFQTGLRIFHVPASTVSAIIKACRENGTTLTPLLHALVLHSLSSRLDNNKAASFRASTPISLRRCTKPGFDRLNTMHCLVTSHSFDYKSHIVSSLRAAYKDADDAMIWSAADSLGQSLRSKISSLTRNDQMGLLGLVSDWNKFWTSQLGTFRKDSWSCSNAGSLKASDSGSHAKGDTWAIDRLFFTQGALPVSAAFHLSVVGVENRGISISLSCQDGVVDPTLVDTVANDVESSLAKFASSGRFC